MNKALLQSYKIEYETTDISIEDLCKKYEISTKDLKGYTKWTKAIEHQQTSREICAPKATIAERVQIVTDESNKELVREEIMGDIDTFKKLAVKRAVHFIKEEAEFAEVKEFKDMVAIVDSIEKSYKDTKDPAGTTINIAIQNLVKKFSDDC